MKGEWEKMMGIQAIYTKGQTGFVGQAGTVFRADRRDVSDLIFFIHGMESREKNTVEGIPCNVNDVLVASRDRAELDRMRRDR